ncbi:MAG: hypothetical protein M5U34_31830 [Chloroflexi bacterium]|nr:hypothetical protein [Chloroflexota bacterium]
MNKDIPQIMALLRLTFGESLDADGRRILKGQTAIGGQPALLWRLNPIPTVWRWGMCGSITAVLWAM